MTCWKVRLPETSLIFSLAELYGQGENWPSSGL